MTKKLTTLTLIISLFLIAGCAAPVKVPADERARFCDVEEKRKFTIEEIKWRTAHAPWNLKRDFKTNLTWDRECVKPSVA